MGGGTKVVPVQSATQQQTEIPQYLKDAGMAATNKAQQINDTPFKRYGGEMVAGLSPTQNKAIDYANGSVNVGQDSLGVAKNALGTANTVARDSINAGGAATDIGAQLAALSGTQARDTMNAGGADLDAARGGIGTSDDFLSGVRGDLNAARNYTAASTRDITGSDLSKYMNPFIRMATDPVADLLTRQSKQNKATIDSKAAMSGSFGGSRSGIVEAQNQRDLSNSLSTLYGNAYSSAYTNAQQQASDALQRYAAAAGLANNTAGQGTAAAGQQTVNANARTNVSNQANTNANDSIARLLNATNSNLSVGRQQSDLATSSLDRLLALISPANSTASTASGLTNDAMQRLLTAGSMEQTYNQNVDNADYQQYLNEINYPTQQLNALIAAAGGVPYGTSTNSNTQGQQVVQTPSMLGQAMGAAAAIVGMKSNRDMKENFGAVDDEDVLEKFRRVPVETYNYIPEVRGAIGDDGRRRIGPMSQDFGREFLGKPDATIIPMPEMMGALVSAVRALDRRTAPVRRKQVRAGVLPRVA